MTEGEEQAKRKEEGKEIEKERKKKKKAGDHEQNVREK